MPYGTLSTADTLGSLAVSTLTIAQIGEDEAFAAITAALDAHNAQVREMMDLLVETTTDRLRRYGGPATVTMDEIDEYGTPDAQKVTAGLNVGFPLRLYGTALQWTRRYFLNATGAELAAQFEAARDADAKLVIRELKRAMFTPTNFTILDRLVDGLSLDVKRFVNADGAGIPVGPNGVTFNGATHTHYLYTAGTTLAAADITALIETLIEHYSSGEPLIYINRAQETVFRGLTGFTAYLDARIIPATNANQLRGQLDTTNLYNRAIGIYGGAEIWVKEWVPAGYLLGTVRGGPKPLVMRERSAGSGDMVLSFDDEVHPLRARGFEREAGWAVWNRTNGAVLYIDSGAAGAYVAPTIT